MTPVLKVEHGSPTLANALQVRSQRCRNSDGAALWNSEAVATASSHASATHFS